MARDHDPSDLDREQTAPDSDHDRTGYAVLTPERRGVEKADEERTVEDDRSPSESAGLATVRPLFRIDTGE